MSAYTPSDILVGPIIHELAHLISTQIVGVDRVYEQVPDGPPEDNAVIIPLTRFEVLDQTNGKLSARLHFGIRHMVRRKSMDEAVQHCYSYLMPYLLCFSAWENQDLGGLAQIVSVRDGGITQMIQAGQVFLALVVNLHVLTEFNIPT